MADIAPLTQEEKDALQHTGHFLAEKVGAKAFDLVAIGGARSGAVIRHFATMADLEKFCESHDLAFRTRDMN